MALCVNSNTTMAKERVHKIIARLGLASRRTAEEWIQEGLVSINGKVASIGDQADLAEDAIKVRGKLLRQTDEKSRVYFAYHKPRGFISTMGDDPQKRPSISQHLTTLKARVFPVGRLEFNQEGLLLLTNDGDFADRLRRSVDVVRVFKIKVDREPTPAEISRLEKGGRVEGRLIKPYSVKLVDRFAKKSMIEVAVQGMGAIDIKTLISHKGFKVDRVILVAIGQVGLGDLEPGAFRTLKKSQIDTILEKPELGLKRVDAKEGLALHQVAPSEDESEELPHSRMQHIPRAPRPGFERSSSSDRPARSWRNDAEPAERTQSFVISSDRRSPSREDSRRPPPFRGRRDDNKDYRAPREGGRPEERRPAKRFESKRSSAAPKVRLSFGGDSRSDSRGPRSDSRGPRSDSRSGGGFRGSQKRSRR